MLSLEGTAVASDKASSSSQGGRARPAVGPAATSPEDGADPPPQDRQLERTLQEIRAALAGLRYGSVVVVVQDGVAVQIERTEKRRLRKA
jgi:hypothetical protein